MNDKNAFDRQLAREIDQLAGPDPRVDVSEVVGRAARPTRRWRLPTPMRTAQVMVAAAVVALFAGFLAMSGILDPTDELDATVGASPSASMRPTPSASSDFISAALPPVKITYVIGTFEDLDEEGLEELGAEMDESEIEAEIELGERLGRLLGPEGDEAWDVSHPMDYLVKSSDARLSGVATVLAIEGYWAHEVTVDDIDADDPDGPWRIDSHHGRLEIRNADGSWSGTSGPAFWATGTEPSDGIPDNAKVFERVGPIVLTGDGAYQGLTAFIDAGGGWLPNDGGSTSFEAVIVNRPAPDAPSDSVWLEALRTQGAGE